MINIDKKVVQFFWDIEVKKIGDDIDKQHQSCFSFISSDLIISC